MQTEGIAEGEAAAFVCRNINVLSRMPQLKPTNNLRNVYNDMFTRQIQAEKITSKFALRGLRRKISGDIIKG
jgi:hypothetical protein